jgi:hypothetical protein
MKILVILGLAGVGAWYLIGRAKESKVVVETQQSAVRYTATLQKDVKKAEDAAAAANKLIKKTAADVENAIPK